MTFSLSSTHNSLAKMPAGFNTLEQGSVHLFIAKLLVEAEVVVNVLSCEDHSTHLRFTQINVLQA